MDRRKAITIMTAALAWPAMAAAQDVGAAIVAQLQAQGFGKIAVETTWLGRLRITASRADGMREIIANPRTGEILRDVWTAASGRTQTAILDQVGDGSETSGSGGSSGSGSDSGSDSGTGSGTGGGSTDGGSSDGGSTGSGSEGGSSGSGDGGGASGGGSSGGGSSGSGDSGRDDSRNDSGDDSKGDKK